MPKDRKNTANSDIWHRNHLTVSNLAIEEKVYLLAGETFHNEDLTTHLLLSNTYASERLLASLKGKRGEIFPDS